MIPPPDPTVITLVLLLLQVPVLAGITTPVPPDDPAQIMAGAPVKLIVGVGLTVTIAETLQPGLVESVIVVVPAVVPVSIPVVAPIAPTLILPELQIPPLIASCNVSRAPVHAVKLPVMTGAAVTVTMVLAEQLPAV